MSVNRELFISCKAAIHKRVSVSAHIGVSLRRIINKEKVKMTGNTLVR